METDRRGPAVEVQQTEIAQPPAELPRLGEAQAPEASDGGKGDGFRRREDGEVQPPVAIEVRQAAENDDQETDSRDVKGLRFSRINFHHPRELSRTASSKSKTEPLIVSRSWRLTICRNRGQYPSRQARPPRLAPPEGRPSPRRATASSAARQGSSFSSFIADVADIADSCKLGIPASPSPLSDLRGPLFGDAQCPCEFRHPRGIERLGP